MAGCGDRSAGDTDVDQHGIEAASQSPATKAINMGVLQT